MAACDSYDEFTTDPSASLIFSEDIVDFDTVLTTEGSSTRTLLVHNKGAKGLRISSVLLGAGADSPFRVNVDGQYLDGGYGSDFEVRTHDSIFVRIECTLPETDKDEVTHYKESLTFVLESGTRQTVSLAAIGMDAYRVSSYTVDDDMVVESARPILVDGTLTVDEGATLTLKAGTRLFFRSNASLLVKGTLKVEGEENKPVVMRGDRTDRLLPYIPYDNLPNRWNGITFEPTSSGNSLVWLDLHSARYGIRAVDTDITLESCIFHNIAGRDSATSHGIFLKNCELVANNTSISNVMAHALYLWGGTAHLTHCTMAQYLLISGGSKGSALHVADKEGSATCEIADLVFDRCLVMGYGSDVISASFVDPVSRSQRISFNECYLNTVKDEEDTRFTSCVYDIDEARKRGNEGQSPALRGLYRLFDTQLYLYDFTPAEGSPCEGYGAVFERQ